MPDYLFFYPAMLRSQTLAVLFDFRFDLVM